MARAVSRVGASQRKAAAQLAAAVTTKAGSSRRPSEIPYTKPLTVSQLGPDETLSAADASERRVEQGLLPQPGGFEGFFAGPAEVPLEI
jgi:hypothetical protein